MGALAARIAAVILLLTILASLENVMTREVHVAKEGGFCESLSKTFVGACMPSSELSATKCKNTCINEGEGWTGGRCDSLLRCVCRKPC